MNGQGVSERSLQLDQPDRPAHADARFFGDTFISRIPRGAGRVESAQRLPYFAEQAEEVLAGIRHLILVEYQGPGELSLPIRAEPANSRPKAQPR